MSTQGITPTLAGSLRSLAESQLQTQVSRSGALDAGALGVVSASVAIAAIVLSVKSAHRLWIATIMLLGLSLGLAIRTLLVAGAKQNGPLVMDILEAREVYDDEVLEEELLNDLAAETLANERALAHKELPLARALTFLIVAIALELVGVQ